MDKPEHINEIIPRVLKKIIQPPSLEDQILKLLTHNKPKSPRQLEHATKLTPAGVRNILYRLKALGLAINVCDGWVLTPDDKINQILRNKRIAL